MLIDSSHYAWRDSRGREREPPPSSVGVVFQPSSFFFFLWAGARRGVFAFCIVRCIFITRRGGFLH